MAVNDAPYDDTAPASMAIERFNKAIALYPDFVEAYYARAHVYLWIDDFDKAIRDFTRVIELDPGYAERLIKLVAMLTRNEVIAI